MNWVKLILQRLRSSFSHPQIDRELDTEMASHLDIAIDDNLKQGMSAEEALHLGLLREHGGNLFMTEQGLATVREWLGNLGGS